MIDQWNDDRTGWARFSDDMTMRYRLARSHTSLPLLVDERGQVRTAEPSRTAVFLMLNSSDADAFDPDPTVTNCCKFSRSWGYSVTEVVNEHAFRSPYPSDLKRRSVGQRGDDAANDESILTACAGADLVVVAWGADGGLDARDRTVLAMLRERRVPLHHLGLTKGGFPKHPMARGRHRIPSNQRPIPFDA